MKVVVIDAVAVLGYYAIGFNVDDIFAKLHKKVPKKTIYDIISKYEARRVNNLPTGIIKGYQQTMQDLAKTIPNNDKDFKKQLQKQADSINYKKMEVIYNSIDIVSTKVTSVASDLLDVIKCRISSSDLTSEDIGIYGTTLEKLSKVPTAIENKSISNLTQMNLQVNGSNERVQIITNIPKKEND